MQAIQAIQAMQQGHRSCYCSRSATVSSRTRCPRLTTRRRTHDQAPCSQSRISFLFISTLPLRPTSLDQPRTPHAHLHPLTLASPPHPPPHSTIPPILSLLAHCTLHTAPSSSSTHAPTLHTHTPSSFSRPRHELDFSATLTATLRPFPRPSPSYDFDSTSTPVTDTHRLHLSALHYHVYEHTIPPLARHRLFDCNCIPVSRLRIQ